MKIVGPIFRCYVTYKPGTLPSFLVWLLLKGKYGGHRPWSLRISRFRPISYTTKERDQYEVRCCCSHRRLVHGLCAISTIYSLSYILECRAKQGSSLHEPSCSGKFFHLSGRKNEPFGLEDPGPGFLLLKRTHIVFGCIFSSFDGSCGLTNLVSLHEQM